jgi:hypothetical protein
MMCGMLGLGAFQARGVNITAATGGGAISADTAANATSPSWTSLGPIVIAENGNADFGVGTNITLILKTPVGFQFNTAVTPSISFTNGANIASAAVAVSDSSTLTITLTVSNTTLTDTVVIGQTTALQVRPTAGTPLATGNHIYRPATGGGTATVAGVATSADGSNGSNFGNLTEVVGNAAQLAITTQPAGATAGAAFTTQPAVRTQDQFGNNSTNGLAATVNVTMTLTSGTGTLQGTTVTNIGTAGGKGIVTYTDLRIDAAGNKQLTASDGALSSTVSSVFTVNAGAFAKIQLLVPGETGAPGTVSGKTGTPTAQTAGTAFNVTVNGVDANWNVVSTATGSSFTMQITSSDPNATLPANANLSSGTATLSVTLKTAGSATLTATDVDNTSLTSVSPSITVNVGALNKLQVLMPGETAAPGTSSGKTGTPTAQTAGTPFNATVNAVDANWNMISTNDTVHLTSSDSNAALPADAALVGGTQTFSVTFNTAGSRTVTASDVTHAGVTANTGAAATVNAGAFTKLQLLMPGESAAPGTGSGKAGSPTAQTAGSAFTVTVNAVDNNWNVVSSTHTVGITSSDANAVLPANAALAAGTRTFNVTFKTAGNQTATATDITDGTKTSNTGSSTVVNSAAFAKMQLLVPGETAAPGSATGKTGTPNTQFTGATFPITVRAVDANWNLINTNDTVQINSSDALAVLPSNSALSAGSASLNVILKTAGTATITASNVTHAAIAGNTSPGITVNVPVLRGGPVVAIHDSELTRALETMTATNPGTPTGAGTTGFEWWPTNWHYFVMPESLKEALTSDGTAYEVVSDADISAGKLMANGQPRYPIMISLACEAVRDDEIAQLTNYVAAGGTLFVGSSSFTRQTNGAGRGDFAIANQLGLHCASTNEQNWGVSTAFLKTVDHPLISHMPSGTVTWRLPSGGDEIPWGVSPSHNLTSTNLAWGIQPTDATVIANVTSGPYLAVKNYGQGSFIYHGGMQPLIAHGGYGPGMYAYRIFRNAIESAFASNRIATPRVSAWPYPYDSALNVRHDFEDYQAMISAIESSSQFESTNGVKGDYYFCTGTLRVEMSNSPTVIASLRRAVTNYGATIQPHNGGLKNVNNTNLVVSDYDYWHWGLDEVLDLTPAGYPNGKAYAFASLSNAFNDVEGWLAGITNGTRAWVSPYFNATRENSFDIQQQLGVKISGEQKLTPFPHWTMSTVTSGKRYPFLALPVSDWYVGSEISQSIEAGHTSASVHALVDAYHSLGALVNLYSHSSSDGSGAAGGLVQDYIRYAVAKPRIWSTNALGIYSWWNRRATVQIVPSFTTTSNRSTLTLAIAGATDPQTAVEALLPIQNFSSLTVFTNGVAAGTNVYRTNGQTLKVAAGTTVTNAVIQYFLNPTTVADSYTAIAGLTRSVAAPGVLANDSPGAGSNLTAVLVTPPVHGVLNLAADGSFNYTADTNYSGVDGFTYKANDGFSDGNIVTVTLSVTPTPNVLFSDDFTRGTDPGPLSPWLVQSGTWTITGGEIQGGTNSLHTYGYSYISNSWTDYAVQARLRFPAGAFGGGLGGRLNPGNGAHYSAWIYPEGSPGGDRMLKLIKFQDWSDFSYLMNIGSPIMQVPLLSVGTNWHTVKVQYEGTQISVFYDGVQMMRTNDAETTPYLSGGISLDMWTDSSSYVMHADDVIVTDPGTAQTITFNAPSNHVYGDVPFFPDVSASSGLPITLSIVSGPATISGTNIAITGIGTVTVRASQSGDASYKAAVSMDAGFNVTPATLTVVPNNVSTVYGSNVPALTASFTGFVNGDTAAVVSGAPILSTSATSTSPAGIYAITATLGALSTANYTFALATGQVNVAKATLNLTANNASRGYGQPDPTFTVVYSGFVNGDTVAVLSGAPAFTTTATPTSPAGNYSIIPSTGTLSAANYTFNFINGTLTIVWSHSLFVDNFMRGSDPGPLSPWIAQSGNWTVTGGMLEGGLSPTFSYGFAYLTNIWTDYWVEARLQFPSGAFGGGLGGRLNPTTGAHYAAWVYPEGSPGGSSVLKLIKFQSWGNFAYLGNGGVPIAQVSLPGVGTSSHTVRLTFQTNLITVLYDSVQMINTNDIEAQPYTSGGICADMWTDSTQYLMSVDDVSVVGPAIDQTITFNPLTNQVYGVAPFALSASASSGLPVSFSVVSGPASLSGNVLTVTNVGSVTIAVSQAGSSDYNPAPSVQRSFNVAPAALAVTADNQSRAYGAANPTLTGNVVGLVNGDNITAIYSTAATAGSPVGTYAITATLSDPSNRLPNYSVVTNNGVITVTPATLTISVDNQSRVYGSPNPSLTGSVGGTQNGDNISATFSTAATTASNVGNYSIVPVLSDPDGKLPNYNVVTNGGTLTVQKAVLGVRADDKSRVYGATNPVFTATYSGFANGDNATVISGAPDLTTSAQAGTATGNYVIIAGPGNLSASNYSFSFTNGVLTIQPAALTGTADTKSRSYGQTNPVFTITYTGFVNGESSSIVTGTLTSSTTATTNSPVGTYPITVSGQSAPNYSINYVPGVLTVNSAQLLITAQNATRAYGQTNPSFTGTITGFVNGEDTNALGGAISFATPADTNSPVGTYPIVPSGLASTNYSITYSNGTLTVTPFGLSVVADNQTRAYGAPNPTFTGTLTGVQNGDNITATYATGATPTNGIGSYSIVPTLNDPADKLTNYSVTVSYGTLTITPANLSITASNQTRLYGATNPVFGGSIVGIQNGDNITASYSTAATPASPVGNYSIVPSLSDPDGKLSNYVTATNHGTLTITAAPLSVTADNKARVYGSADPAFTGDIVGIQNNDNVTASYSSTATASTPVGNYAIVPALADPDTKLSNYLVTTNDGSLAINPAALTGTADNKSRLYGQTNPVFTVTYTGFVNSENSGVVTGTLLASSPADTNSAVGTYPITISGQVAPNYNITYVPGILNVNPATLLVQADNKTRAYGHTNPVLTASILGFVNGEGSNVLAGNLALSTLAETNSPIGSYPIVPGGLTSTNYSITYSNGTLTVTPFALSVVANNQTRTYGAPNPALTGTLTGVQNGDNITASYSTTATVTNSVGTYSIVPALNDPANRLTNYSVTASNGTLTITAAALSVTASNETRIYGATNPISGGSITGIQNGDNITATYSTTATSASPVGVYNIVPTLSDPDGKLSNYLTSTNDGTLTITAAPLTVTVDNKVRVYGSANPAFTGNVLGIQNSDNITATYSTTATQSSPIGSYAITPALADPDSKLGNYAVSITNGTLVINPAPLTGTAENKSRLYGETNPVFTVAYTGFANNEDTTIVTGTLLGSSPAQTNSPVGTYPITVSGQSAPNYNINYAPGVLTINPAALLVRADNRTRAYGQTNPVLTATITGFVNGEDTNVLGGSLVLSTTAQTNSPIGDYPIISSGLTSTNYSITYSNGTLTVTSYALSVIADNQTRPYGAANPALTGALIGVQSGDNITATYATAATPTNGIGSYSIVPTLNDPANKLTNYSVTVSNGTLTVTAANLTVTAANQTRLYGATNPVFGGSIVGVQNGDNITATYSSAATPASPVGTYGITPTLSDPDGKLSNYLTSTNNGTLTIMAAPLTVTVDDKARTYGSANPVFTGNVLGIQNGDNVTATYSTAATQSSPVGNYPIAPMLADPDSKLGNYLVSTTNGTLAINPAPLTGTADNKSRLYGETNPIFTVTYTGFVNSENSSNVTGTLVAFSPAETNSPVGMYPITVSGQTAPNYNITYVPGTLTVNPAALLVQANDKSRAYGQTNPVLTATFTGFVNAEDTNVLAGALTLSTAADTNSPIGTYPIVPSGLASTNYSITYSNGLLTVTQHSLSVIADNQTRAYGAPNPTLTGTLTGVQNGDNITASYSTTATATNSVGTYSIVPTLNDPANKLTNYSVTTSNGTLTITTAALSVTASNQTRLYGAANPTLGGSIVGIQNGDNITATFLTAATQASPVGNYSIVPSLADPDNKLSNYTVSTNNGTLTINAAELTGTADNKSRLYGQTNPVFTVTYTGFVNGEDSSIVTGTLISSTPADTNTPVGTYPITISGPVAPNYNITYVDGVLTITAASSSLALSSSTNPAPQGSNVTFTASLSAVAPGAGTPTGAVQFYTNGSPSGSPVSLSSGTAAISLSTLPPGTNTVAAVYAGDGNFLGSSNSILQVITATVADVPSTLALTNNGDATITLTLRGTPGTQYVLQAKDDLLSGSWSNLSTNTASSKGVWTYTESTAGHTSRFYRLVKFSAMTSVIGPARPQTLSLSRNPDGTVTARFHGTPATHYIVQASDNILGPWTSVSTNAADINGFWTYTESTAGHAARYFRSALP